MFTGALVGEIQSIPCSSLSPNLYGGRITIECLESGMWGTLDISQCTFKKEGVNGLLLVEVTEESKVLYVRGSIFYTVLIHTPG